MKKQEYQSCSELFFRTMQSSPIRKPLESAFFELTLNWNVFIPALSGTTEKTASLGGHIGRVSPLVFRNVSTARLRAPKIFEPDKLGHRSVGRWRGCVGENGARLGKERGSVMKRRLDAVFLRISDIGDG